MRIGGTIALAAGLGCLLAALAPGRGEALNREEYHNPFGVYDHVLYEEMAKVGAVWIRHPLAIRRLHPDASTYTWGPMNSDLTQTEAYDLNYAPVLSLGECWLTGYPDSANDFPSHPPYDLTATPDPVTAYSAVYYQFIFDLVSQFSGRIDHLTIENEGNAEHFWAGSPSEYVRTLKTAYKAAHDADPEVDILDSGIASEAWGAMVLRDWIESGTVSEAKILQFANDYYDRSVYSAMDFANMSQLTDWLYSDFVNGQYQRIAYMMENMGGGLDALNIKYTEYYWLYPEVIDWIRGKMAQSGYTVEYIVNNEASVWPTRPYVPGASEDQYARELVQQYCMALSLGVDRTIWFPLSWAQTPTPRIALLDTLDNWMTQAHAFRNAADIIGHQFAFRRVDNTVSDVLQFVFEHREDPGRHLRVCWFDDGTHTAGSKLVRFDLPLATTRVLLTDHVGNRRTTQVLGRSYVDVTVTQTPVFFEVFEENALVSGLEEAGPGAEPRLLEQNYPNPFNPQTTIRFRAPGEEGEWCRVSLLVYDAGGRLVRRLIEGSVAAGRQVVHWDGRTEGDEDAPPGVYLYRLTAGETVETRKMILAR